MIKKEVKTFRSIHSISFLHAFEGVKAAFKSQPNLRFHFFAIVIVSIMALVFQISVIEWLILVLTFFMVIIAEMANTAMEATVDLITSEWHEEAKFAKDVTAGGVLLSAIGSIIIGLTIFLPKISKLLF